MQTLIVIILLACVLILPIRAFAQTKAEIPRSSIGDASYVFMGFSGRCPRMETSPDGRLMLIYEIGRQIRVTFSEDGGKHWKDDTPYERHDDDFPYVRSRNVQNILCTS